MFVSHAMEIKANNLSSSVSSAGAFAELKVPTSHPCAADLTFALTQRTPSLLTQVIVCCALTPSLSQDNVRMQGNWMGTPCNPQSGTSYGRPSQYVMGTSPYGKSIDMVDVCTKLMEGALLVICRKGDKGSGCHLLSYQVHYGRKP